MVTRKQKIWETPILTWVIQIIEALTVCYGQDLVHGDKLMLIDRFSNDNDFSSTIHKGGIIWVAKDDDEQENDKKCQSKHGWRPRLPS